MKILWLLYVAYFLNNHLYGYKDSVGVAMGVALELCHPFSDPTPLKTLYQHMKRNHLRSKMIGRVRACSWPCYLRGACHGPLIFLLRPVSLDICRCKLALLASYNTIPTTFS